MMKQILLFGLILLVGCHASSEEKEIPKERFLYLMHAKRADFKYHEANPSYATLTLSSVGPEVTFFTERPVRKGGVIPIEDFLHEWSEGQKSFQEVPPNAGLVFYQGEDQTYHEVSLELRKPIYDPHRNQLQFNVFLLEPFEGISVEEVTLFIDSRTISESTMQSGPTFDRAQKEYERFKTAKQMVVS